MDNGFKTEAHFFLSLVGAPAVVIMEKKIVSILPGDQQKNKKLSDVSNDMGKLVRSPLTKFMGTSLGVMVSTVHGFLQTMQKGRCPKFPGGTETEFMSSVKRGLALLCNAKCSATNDVKYGAEAAEILYTNVSTKVAKGPLKDCELNPLSMHAWLLPADKVKQLQLWNNAVMGPEEALVATASSSSSGPKGKQGAGRKRAAPSDVEPTVGKVFKR